MSFHQPNAEDYFAINNFGLPQLKVAINQRFYLFTTRDHGNRRQQLISAFLLQSYHASRNKNVSYDKDGFYKPRNLYLLPASIYL
ncbi:MAG: hypothetical protein ACKE51_00195 [Methylococcaceae bacterium]